MRHELVAIRARAAARDQFAAHHRHRQGQGPDRLVRDQGRASARRRHHHRPLRRRGARRHPLRDAAARALRRHRHLPGLVRASTTRARRSTALREALIKAQEFLRMTDDPSKVRRAPKASAAQRPPRYRPRRRLRRLRMPASLRRCRTDELARLTDDIDRGAQDRLRSGNPVRHLRARPRSTRSISPTTGGEGRHDAHHAELSFCAGAADHGGERGCERARRRRGQGQIVWDPPWDPSRMSDEARAVLNMW